jgi:hypothetical protein
LSVAIEYTACQLDEIRAREREREWIEKHTVDTRQIELKADKARIHEALMGQRFHRTVKVTQFKLP